MDRSDLVDIKVEDLASVLLRFDNGATGSVSVGQVCAGHKNDLVLEVCGPTGSIRWRQEDQNELWLGHRERAERNAAEGPSLAGSDVRHYARLPGGHQEGWADAFANVIRDIYEFIASGKGPADARPPTFATFDDGYRAARVVEAILASARTGALDAAYEHPSVRAEVHEGGRPDRGAAGADPARRSATPIPTAPSRTGCSSPASSDADYIQLSAALHPSRADVPAGGDARSGGQHARPARSPSTRRARERVAGGAAMPTGVGMSRPRLLRQHAPRRPRRSGAKKHDFMLRVFDAAVAAGRRRGLRLRRPQPEARAWTRTSIASRATFVPLLQGGEGARAHLPRRAVPDAGLDHAATTSTTTSPTRPGTWIALHRICEKHGVGDQFRIHYDPSHAILMGQDTRSIFQYLKDDGLRLPDRRLPREGPGHRRQGRRRPGATAARPIERGDWIGRQAVAAARPTRCNAWKKQTVLCEHELPGTAKHDPLAYLQNRTVDWLDHQLAARELLTLDVAQHPPGRRARVPAGAHPGQGAARADPEGLDRLRPQDRRGRGLHVRAAARGAGGPGHPGPGHRPPAVSVVVNRGASPLGLPHTLSRAPLRRRAPFAWLARALARVASQSGLRPSDSPHALSRAAPSARSVRVARSLRSLASKPADRGFAPRTPPHALSRAAAPARSVRVARSLRSLAQIGGFAPRTPPHALSRAAAPARSVRVARSRARSRQSQPIVIE